jgi:2-phospho-L-lactate guanylyltransferase
VTVGAATARPVTGASPGARLLGPAAVLVPIKAFAEAKRRLEPALDDAERLALVHQMAERVVAAAAPLPVAVVCDDNEVATWARRHGALVIWEPGRGLNGAVEEGVARLARMGVEQVTVAHGDLPRASGIGSIEAFDGVTLVPDRHGDGTNVIRLPARSGFRFSYGPGSFSRHRAECARLGVASRIVSAPDLTWDVDVAADLVWP